MTSNETETTSTARKRNAPVERFNDGAVKATIFRNINGQGQPFYNVTFARVYTDADKNIRETQSFSGTDVLKVRRLADQAYHAVDRLKKADRAQAKEQNAQKAAQPSNGRSLSEQRDAVMNTQPQQQGQSNAQTHDQGGPELSQ